MTVTPDDSGVTPFGDTASTRVIAVVGPTAAGKTRIAEALAARWGGEIVSADSMQVYRGMDIGTAKPAPDERLVPYHCIDLVDPGGEYSASLYQRDARRAITDIAARDRLPLVVGGTGLYVRAALDDLEFPAGNVRSATRERLEADAALLGAEVLHRRLAAVDPASAAIVHPNNVRRTIRALEMAEEGISYAERASGLAQRTSVYSTTFLGLYMHRDVLYARIDERVDHMMQSGLMTEVEELLAAGYRDAVTAGQAIGYKELVPVLETNTPLDEAIASIKQATRRYAKRQLTWFRADPRIMWLDVTDLSFVQSVQRAAMLLESNDHDPRDFAAPA